MRSDPKKLMRSSACIDVNAGSTIDIFSCWVAVSRSAIHRITSDPIECPKLEK
ncbi:hypothetical protein CRM22_001985 [Opisthorchis felineus]|uniref:Uncharacterized protein n=1 Tax=Opisthorchis felineus TaxID=147828 RepID=A0A4S2M855_OPIFE|nr:hypothetical protein CRM22_001985 [Opisthorchis felineus]